MSNQSCNGMCAYHLAQYKHPAFVHHKPAQSSHTALTRALVAQASPRLQYMVLLTASYYRINQFLPTIKRHTVRAIPFCYTVYMQLRNPLRQIILKIT